MVFMFLCFASKGQNVVTGVVINDRNQSQPRVKISVNKSAYTQTNKDGKFDVEIRGEKPKIVEIQKAGFEILKWDYSEDKGLTVIIAAEKKTFSGSVLYADGSNAGAQKIEFIISGGLNFQTNSDVSGKFQIALPGDLLLSELQSVNVSGKRAAFKISQENFFTLTTDKNPAAKSDVQQSANNLSASVTLQFLENDKPLAKIEFQLDGLKILTDKDGKVKVPRGALSKLSPGKFSIVKIDSTGSDYFIIRLKKASASNQEIEGNFNDVIEKLEQQKQRAVAENALIYAKINDINEKLKNNPNLSDDEKKQLRGTLLRLEGQVENNNKAFEEAQKKTTALIVMLRNTLEQKDSVSNAAQERLKAIELEKERERVEAQRKIIIISTIALVMAFASFAFYSILRKVRKQKAEIAAQAASLAELNSLVVSKNEKITDSIRYALTIQQAVLPDDDRLNAVSEQHFVIFRPKDIVSGDFYWVSDPNRHKDILVACVDCTGHGVSGAFMSLISNTLLNQIVNIDGLTDTAKILEQLNTDIRKSLKQEQKANKDGMDLAICKITREEEQILISFTGAKRPIWIMRENSDVVEVYKGDLKSIGGDLRKNRDFTVQEIIVRKGDTLYMMTDGFVDQCNDAKEKFGTKRLLETIPQISRYDLISQKKQLQKLLDEHQKQEEQRDDITIIAFRF